MLPPEFYEQLQRIKDHYDQNPPPPTTVKERAKTGFFIALFLFFVLAFAIGWFYQEVMPWITWILGWFN